MAGCNAIPGENTSQEIIDLSRCTEVESVGRTGDQADGECGVLSHAVAWGGIRGRERYVESAQEVLARIARPWRQKSQARRPGLL